jgi:hypothetical protein
VVQETQTQMEQHLRLMKRSHFEQVGQICARSNHLRFEERDLAKRESVYLARLKDFQRKEKNLNAREKTFERRETTFTQKHMLLQTNMSKLKADEENIRLQRATVEKANALVAELFLTLRETESCVQSVTSELLKQKLSIDEQVSEVKLQQEKINSEKLLLGSLMLEVGKATAAYKTRFIKIYEKFRDACQAKRLENLSDAEGTYIHTDTVVYIM